MDFGYFECYVIQNQSALFIRIFMSISFYVMWGFNLFVRFLFETNVPKLYILTWERPMFKKNYIY